MRIPRPLVYGLLLCGLFVIPSPVDAQVTVFITPKSPVVRAGATQQFTPYVYLTPNKAVIWTVNGVPGGNATIGTIGADGLYSAPSMPAPVPIVVSAISLAAPAVGAYATVTLLNPQPTITSVAPPIVAPGPFSLIVDGAGFAPGAVVRFGSTTLSTARVSDTRLIASGTIAPVVGRLMAVSVSNPDPGASVSGLAAVAVGPTAPKVSALAAARFLEQVSWGADPASIARVQELGFSAYLDEQFAEAPSTYPEYPSTSTMLLPVQQRFVVNALTGPDQLRQRIAFALGQIFVVSGYKLFTPQMYVPWLRLLSDHAFGTYGDLLTEVTLSPSMGRFLDMVDNEKDNAFLKSAANENYAREILQLFTIGTERLNLDGTVQVGSDGQPLPTYDQAVVAALARAFTGWTFPTSPGATPSKHNPPYYAGRMEPRPVSHDTYEKVILDGYVLPAGQTPEQDLGDALGRIEQHPNVGPFFARRMIQHLVTSNPSPDYVARVAAVFNNNGAGVRGDLRAVIKAIVLDPEARLGDSGYVGPADGHLREPVLFTMALLRALRATSGPTSLLASIISPAGQSLFYPPSVFNYFSPENQLADYGLIAPEFQIFTPSTAVYRANIAFYATFAAQTAGLTMDLSTLDPLAADPPLLVEAVNQALLYGRMPPEMRRTIEAAVGAVTMLSPRTRVQTALFLVASSSHYQVQQ